MPDGTMMLDTARDRSVGSACATPRRNDRDGGRVPEHRWFVVQTHPQAERWAQENLKRSGYDVFLPLVTVRKRDPVLRTMTRLAEVPLFPGYEFVHLRVGTSWTPILYTEGVKAMLRYAMEPPRPVPVGVVERLIDAADERKVVESLAVAVGRQVILTEGPFADHEGVCLWSDETRIRVGLMLFGRVREVPMRRDAVRVK